MRPTQPAPHPFPALAAHPLLGFPALWLPDLPEPIALHLDVPGAPVPVVFATGSLAHDNTVLPPLIRFDGEELRALVVGVEADRIWHRDLLALCFEKWRRPEFRLDGATALAGANPCIDRAPWTLERVLRRLQARLESVSWASDAPLLQDASDLPHTPAGWSHAA